MENEKELKMFRHRYSKKIAAILTTLLVLTSVNSNSLAQSSVKVAPKPAVAAQKTIVTTTTQIPKELENTIRESAAGLYGKENADTVYNHVLALIEKARSQRRADLKQNDIERNAEWYKDEVVYMMYADQFGVKDKNSKSTFKDMIGMLDYLKELGVTTIYVLPFADSPMGDAGFDVRDPRNVRNDLGGMQEFKEFADAARAKGFKITSDMILNHLSDQHQWFQEALKGDIKKLNYFIVSDKKPVYKRYRDEKMGIVVDYTEDNGLVSTRRIIFPDICENNYRKVSINGKDYYLYHTFYPFQLDLNWENPDLLYYMLDTLGYWANIGVDIFRLDAIPFLIKEKGTMGENRPKTHDIIRLMSAYLQAVGPRSVLLAEACQWPKDIKPFFGQEHTIPLADNKQLTRTNEVQLAYHFPYMPGIWASLVTGDKGNFWKAYQSTPQIPNTASWELFLRVHDELTLEMVDVNTRKVLYDNLSPKGAGFREGLGVSGRLANFLDNNPDRIAQAFSIFFSLPGVPIIYYGDEIGAQNNWEYAKAFAKQREETQKAKGGVDVKSFFDSRDINRGPVLKEAYLNAVNNKDIFGNKIYTTVKNLIKVRKENPVLTRGSMMEVRSDKDSLFTYLRENNQEQVLAIHNLSKESIKGNIYLPRDTVKRINSNTLLDLISNKQIKVRVISNGLKITLKPYQSLWLKL